MNKAEVTKNDVKLTKFFNGRNHMFEVDHLLDEDTAIRLQAELTYPAQGYGFYGFNPSHNKTTWFCYGSCD
jgi:hypothetical protein